MATQAQRTILAADQDSRKLPDTTSIHYAHFRVADLERSLGFYRDMLGLVETKSEGNTLTLSSEGSAEPLVRLTEDRNAKPRSPRAPGLFHLALLYPQRRDLAAAFKHLYVNRWPFQGFADHGVSEALYLADAEGNGIELYIDRPKTQWPYVHGELQMVTESLDLDNLLSELASPGKHDVVHSKDLAIGHIHLQVSDLHRAEEFYHTALGFDVTQRNFPGALFMAAGGYHHHIGTNVWGSRGGTPAGDDSSGLIEFGIKLGNALAVRDLSTHLRSTPYWLEDSGDGFSLRDPDHIRLTIS